MYGQLLNSSIIKEQRHSTYCLYLSLLPYPTIAADGQLASLQSFSCKYKHKLIISQSLSSYTKVWSIDNTVLYPVALVLTGQYSHLLNILYHFRKKLLTLVLKLLKVNCYVMHCLLTCLTSATKDRHWSHLASSAKSPTTCGHVSIHIVPVQCWMDSRKPNGWVRDCIIL